MLRGDLEPDIFAVDLKENVRDGDEVPRAESLRLKKEDKGMLADFEEALCGEEAGEHDELCRMKGMFVNVNCRHPHGREFELSSKG